MARTRSFIRVARKSIVPVTKPSTSTLNSKKKTKKVTKKQKPTSPTSKSKTIVQKVVQKPKSFKVKTRASTTFSKPTTVPKANKTKPPEKAPPMKNATKTSAAPVKTATLSKAVKKITPVSKPTTKNVPKTSSSATKPKALSKSRTTPIKRPTRSAVSKPTSPSSPSKATAPEKSTTVAPVRKAPTRNVVKATSQPSPAKATTTSKGKMDSTKKTGGKMTSKSPSLPSKPSARSIADKKKPVAKKLETKNTLKAAPAPFERSALQTVGKKRPAPKNLATKSTSKIPSTPVSKRPTRLAKASPAPIKKATEKDSKTASTSAPKKASTRTTSKKAPVKKVAPKKTERPAFKTRPPTIKKNADNRVKKASSSAPTKPTKPSTRTTSKNAPVKKVTPRKTARPGFKSRPPTIKKNVASRAKTRPTVKKPKAPRPKPDGPPVKKSRGNPRNIVQIDDASEVEHSPEPADLENHHEPEAAPQEAGAPGAIEVDEPAEEMVPALRPVQVNQWGYPVSVELINGNPVYVLHMDMGNGEDSDGEEDDEGEDAPGPAPAEDVGNQMEVEEGNVGEQGEDIQENQIHEVREAVQEEEVDRRNQIRNDLIGLDFHGEELGRILLEAVERNQRRDSTPSSDWGTIDHIDWSSEESEHAEEEEPVQNQNNLRNQMDLDYIHGEEFGRILLERHERRQREQEERRIQEQAQADPEPGDVGNGGDEQEEEENRQEDVDGEEHLVFGDVVEEAVGEEGREGYDHEEEDVIPNREASPAPQNEKIEEPFEWIPGAHRRYLDETEEEKEARIRYRRQIQAQIDRDPKFGRTFHGYRAAENGARGRTPDSFKSWAVYPYMPGNPEYDDDLSERGEEEEENDEERDQNDEDPAAVDNQVQEEEERDQSVEVLEGVEDQIQEEMEEQEEEEEEEMNQDAQDPEAVEDQVQEEDEIEQNGRNDNNERQSENNQEQAPEDDDIVVLYQRGPQDGQVAREQTDVDLAYIKDMFWDFEFAVMAFGHNDDGPDDHDIVATIRDPESIEDAAGAPEGPRLNDNWVKIPDNEYSDKDFMELIWGDHNPEYLVKQKQERLPRAIGYTMPFTLDHRYPRWTSDEVLQFAVQFLGVDACRTLKNNKINGMDFLYWKDGLFKRLNYDKPMITYQEMLIMRSKLDDLMEFGNFQRRGPKYENIKEEIVSPCDIILNIEYDADGRALAVQVGDDKKQISELNRLTKARWGDDPLTNEPLHAAFDARTYPSDWTNLQVCQFAIQFSSVKAVEAIRTMEVTGEDVEHFDMRLFRKFNEYNKWISYSEFIEISQKAQNLSRILRRIGWPKLSFTQVTSVS